ncbi:DUF6678 family protein [uncultured Massilia sp.]|uniref:DUF6678 family protein n=1 Tax=uncultured Massilia sp. TaxID=169973 RepID=UPI00259000CA|nr:DUF6678 family protein [uncultured Massilia sp.]
MDQLPTASAGYNDATRKKINAIVAKRNLSRASNNTRWNELINHFRHSQERRPFYRFKTLDDDRISGWDSEWFYHLPFPFSTVEWFDIGLKTKAGGRLLAPVDNTDEISRAVQNIGFEFEVRADVLRIWGYLPKSYEDFPGLTFSSIYYR